jgi:hypothetical protein
MAHDTSVTGCPSDRFVTARMREGALLTRPASILLWYRCPTARDQSSLAAEKFPSGREHLDLPPSAANQRLQRFANRDVIVDDEDDRCGVRHRDVRFVTDGTKRSIPITSFWLKGTTDTIEQWICPRACSLITSNGPRKP